MAVTPKANQAPPSFFPGGIDCGSIRGTVLLAEHRVKDLVSSYGYAMLASGGVVLLSHGAEAISAAVMATMPVAREGRLHL